MKRFKCMVTLFTALIAVVLCFSLVSCGNGAQGVSGVVYDKIYGDKLPELLVKFISLDDWQETKTYPDRDGEFSVSLKPGKYRMEIIDERTEFKYAKLTKGYVIEEGKWIENEKIEVDIIVKTFISGQVLENGTKKPIPGAKITLGDKTMTTDKQGRYEFKYIRPGNTHLMIEAKGYAPNENLYNVSSGQSIEDFFLTKALDIGNAKIKSVHDILSYRVEIAQGTDKDNIKSAIKMTVNNLPFALEVESPEGDGRYVLSGAFLKNNGVYEKTTEDAFKKLKQHYFDFDIFLKSAIDQFHSQKVKENNVAAVPYDQFSVIPYPLSLTIDSKKYDATFYIIFDGPNKGFPIKLTLSRSGEYKEISLSLFNDVSNIIKEP